MTTRNNETGKKEYIGYLDSLVAGIVSHSGFCKAGVNSALEALRSKGIKGFVSFEINGPRDKPHLYVLHFKEGKNIAEVHYVAMESNKGVTIDVFQKPFHRVFPTLEDYLKMSGIQFTNDPITYGHFD